jgi:ribose/xylose/arabinose/galactoside ABC-type transport system permease subunit
MVYEDSTQARAGSVIGAGPADADPTVTLADRVPPPNLDLVFQDPADGEPGRDRMMVHGLWEVVLALALAGAGYALSQARPGALGALGLPDLALATTVLGLVAAASAVSLRAGAPNLAVGGVAVFAALYLGQHGSGGWLGPAATVIGICAAIGVAQGLVVVGLQVPAWAASLAAAIGLVAWSSGKTAGALGAGYDPAPHAYYWFGGFCLLSVGASALGLVPTIRRGFGRFRPVIDPARRRGKVAALITLGATVASSALAGLGGVLALSVYREAAPTNGLELTALALGGALLGGTSAFGRRGGIFGTVFAVALLSVGLAYAQAAHRPWSAAGIATVAILVGLCVTRLVERFGRPTPPRLSDDDDWSPRVHSLAPAGRSWQPAPTPAGGLWASDDPWGVATPR